MAITTWSVGLGSRRVRVCFCLTGGKIGPSDQALTVTGPAAGMPAYFSNSDVDEWVPLLRTEAAVEAFRASGTNVEF